MHPAPEPPVFIRKVTPADTEAVLALWRVVFPEYGDAANPQRTPSASVARKLAFGDGLFWAAEREGRLVGTAMAGYDGHRGWLYSVGVHPESRGAGIGSTLVQVAERALAALGCPKVNLQVFATNAGARAFWRSAGYAEDGVVSFGKRLVLDHSGR
jgi:ribosomal protein S18 acetylase RimI-like enzyme